MDDGELGWRIAYWRERRGVTQRLLADRIGRSKSWIEKVEAGTRSASRLPILLTICQELRVDLPVLIGRDVKRDTRNCIDDAQVDSIRVALENYAGISTDIPADYEPSIGRLGRRVLNVWAAFELTDYDVVSRTLPGLLLDAQSSDPGESRQLRSDHSRNALEQLYEPQDSLCDRMCRASGKRRNSPYRCSAAGGMGRLLARHAIGRQVY
jgi:transcriptional regulator with XRE-family HTH domain